MIIHESAYTAHFPRAKKTYRKEEITVKKITSMFLVLVLLCSLAAFSPVTTRAEINPDSDPALAGGMFQQVCDWNNLSKILEC